MTDVTGLPGFSRVFAADRLTVGLALPLDGPDPWRAAELVQRAERSGFAAVWARDIPLSVETFGDDGQEYDPFMYLTWLAAQTGSIALGTAAVVLPLAHPLLLAKRAAGLDLMSRGRFILGLASGDRPEEFRAFGLDKGDRGEIFRENLSVLDKAWEYPRGELHPISWSRGRVGGAEVVPKPTAGRVPRLMVGSCLQSMEFNVAHGDGWLTYHRSLPEQKIMIDRWRATARELGVGFRPFGESLWLDVLEDPDAPAQGRDFGYRLGRNALLELLDSQRRMGINHVSVNLRHGRRPVEEVMDELGEYVIPEFPVSVPPTA